MKKIITFIIVFFLAVTLYEDSTSAENELTVIVPDVSMLNSSFEQGSKVQLKFIYFSECQKLRYNINIYIGEKIEKDSLVKSESEELYLSEESFGTSNFTIEWDTKENTAGIYTVEYSMEYYSADEWHEAKSEVNTFTVELTSDETETEIKTGQAKKMDDANEAISGQQYFKIWTSDNTKDHCYNKFIMKNDGYMKINMIRPCDMYDNVFNLKISVYNASNKALVWEHDTHYAVESHEVCYQVGVPAGVYYVDIAPYSTYVISGKFKVRYSISEYATDYYEKENNGGLSSATKLEYDHVYGAEIANSKDEEDYFKFDVTEGNAITVLIGNYGKLESSSLIMDLLDKNGKDIYYVEEDYYAASDVGMFTWIPNYTGSMYFKIYNMYADPIHYTICVQNGTNETVSTGKTEQSAEEMVYGDFATYQGFIFTKSPDGSVTCRDASGNAVKNNFKCDGTYTYYFGADGKAMKDRLTYHPDGVHVIYFDKFGHEVFSDFAHISKSIAGDDVDDNCFFDVFGYMYVDVLTYDKTGTKLLYANPYGRLECAGWFQFSNSVVWADGTPCDGIAGQYGFGQTDCTLLTNTSTYDWQGRATYLQGNGVALYQ